MAKEKAKERKKRSKREEIVGTDPIYGVNSSHEDEYFGKITQWREFFALNSLPSWHERILASGRLLQNRRNDIMPWFSNLDIWQILWFANHDIGGWTDDR